MSPCCTLWEGVYQSWVYPNTWQECGEIDTLVDVTTIAQEAGFRCCVAVTEGLMAAIETIPTLLS